MTRLSTLVACAAMACALAGSVSGGAVGEPDGAGPSLVVSAFSLGVTGGALAPADLARALNEGGWCAAEAARGGRTWRDLPAGRDSWIWVAAVTAGFGEQAHAYAFLLDPETRAPRLITHVPYGMSWVHSTRVWVPPVDRLAAAVRSAWPRSAPPVPRAGPTVRVMAWESSGVGDGDAGGTAGELLDDMAPMQTAATVTTHDGLPPFEVLALGAAAETTWPAAPGTTDDTLTIEVMFKFGSASLRVTRVCDGVRTVRVRPDVPEERYAATLRRVFFCMARPDGPSDIVDLGRAGEVRLLAASGDRVCALLDGDPVASDCHTGLRVWPEPPPPDAPARTDPLPWVARRLGDGRSVILKRSRFLVMAAIENGAEQTLASLAPSSPWAFDMDAATNVVLAAGRELHAFAGGERRWQHEERYDIDAGPVFGEGRVVAANADAEVFALAAATGRELWRVRGASALRGRLICAGDRVVGFARAEEGVVAMRLADGTPLWRHSVGDRLLQAPVMWDGHVLIVGRNNRVTLLDPGDGTVVCDRVWSTWLTDVLPVDDMAGRSLLVCADIRGRLSILSGPRLKTVREIRLVERPVRSLLYVSRFPFRWGADAGASDDIAGLSSVAVGPVVLAADRDGFCYILPLAEEH